MHSMYDEDVKTVTLDELFEFINEQEDEFFVNVDLTGGKDSDGEKVECSIS